MKVLLVQTGFLGDTLLSTPVISALRQKHEASDIWMLVNEGARSIVERHPDLAGVMSFDKRGVHRGLLGMTKLAREIRNEGFDVAYSLHRSFRTALLLFLSRIPLRIGFRDSVGKLFYHVRKVRPQHVHDVVRRLSIVGEGISDLPMHLVPPEVGAVRSEINDPVSRLGKYAVVSPGSVWETKRWQAKGFREVCSWLLGHGFGVVLCGAKNEKPICDEVASGLPVVNIGGQTSLDELSSVISRASVVVCNDSLPLHMASALQIPTVAVFCATSPEQGFGPWRNRSRIVLKPHLWCRPCGRHGGKECPTGTRSCVEDLSSAKVIRELESLLQEVGKLS